MRMIERKGSVWLGRSRPATDYSIKDDDDGRLAGFNLGPESLEEGC